MLALDCSRFKTIEKCPRKIPNTTQSSDTYALYIKGHQFLSLFIEPRWK